MQPQPFYWVLSLHGILLRIKFQFMDELDQWRENTCSKAQVVFRHKRSVFEGVTV